MIWFWFWSQSFLCPCRRGDLDRLPSDRKHHRFSRTGKRQNHQTVEERLLERLQNLDPEPDSDPGPDPEPHLSNFE